MRTTLWASLLVILLCATALAQQANVLQPYRLSQFATDARLRQPATFTALSVPLSDALQRHTRYSNRRHRHNVSEGSLKSVFVCFNASCRRR